MTTEHGPADVFISHAHEDKEVARPLAEALRQRGLTVWYDEYVLRLGDSLREVIERGLASSRFGVVILSPSFFAKEWPQRELNALLARETTKRSKVLLPVWHNLTLEEVTARSPILADRLAVSSAKGILFIVEQIVQVLEAEKPRSPLAVSPPSIGKEAASIEEITENGIVFVRIRPGSFIMGSAEDDPQASDNEKPAHQVTLSEFWIGKTAITNEQYRRFRPDHSGEANLPVPRVNWAEARAACEFFGGRLPTEAEWEYAARAGSQTAWSFGDDEKRTGEYAWYRENADRRRHPVGTKKPNAWGLHDMHGNVWEWVADLYGPYTRAAQTDPSGPTTGEERVLRGGYLAACPDLRSAIRVKTRPRSGTSSSASAVVAAPAASLDSCLLTRGKHNPFTPVRPTPTLPTVILREP